MKKYLIIAFVAVASRSVAQKATSPATLKDLAVPSSPAFIITDITPTLVQNPNTPKSFVLGVAQSLQQSGAVFPNNFSAEFAPYWWVKANRRNVYNYLGLKKTGTGYKENPFAGLKYTSLSVAFVNKDMIPDAADISQKIFSVGIRTTLIKAHRSNYAKDLDSLIKAWHEVAQAELISNEDVQRDLAILGSDASDDARADIIERYQPISTLEILKKINNLIDQKPKFVLDIAAASSTYGVNDEMIKAGRTGAWTTASFYLPFSKKTDNKNYFDISGSFRYLTDNFQKDAAGVIGYGDNVDIGGKAGFEFNQLSVGVESLYRFAKGVANNSNRTVGVINVKLMDNLFINGTFGKDFAGPNKLISTFGINWGFGKEKVAIETDKN
jgi:hypothetical protein